MPVGTYYLRRLAMKKALALLAVAALALSLGCGKSGTKPKGPGQPPSTDSALSPSTTDRAPSGELSPAELGKRSLVGANPAPVVDTEISEEGAIVQRYNAEPGTLNPLVNQDAYGGAIWARISDSLATRNLDTLEWEPRLAESWGLSEDHLTYTFHLRKDVRWQNGRPFTSADVVYSYQTMMNPKVNAPQQRNYYIDLDTVTAPDDYTVVFTWKKPYFLSFSSSAEMNIFARHVFDDGQEFNTHPAGRRPVGNGMYRFVSWKTGEEMVLERNEDYYGRKPHIKKIVIRFIPDDNSALQQARSGTIDTMGVRAEQWVRTLPEDAYRERFSRYYYYDPNYSYIGWNHKRPFFADKRVRRAMTHLVDRKAILENVLYGLGTIVTGTFYLNSADYSPEIVPLPFDPAAAKRLLDEAGWVDHDGDGIRDKLVDGQPVKFSFTYMHPSGSSTGARIAVLLQEQLKRVGIEMNIQNLEWATFTQRLENAEFDAVTLAWSLGIEQDPYQLWHSTQNKGGSNFISFANAELDVIIEQARTEFDAAKRAALYHRFNAIIDDEQPYTFLFCTPSLAIVDKRMHNVILHKLGLDSRDWYIPPALQKPL
jgi:peptide/nickel transport system substrate-binding protein